MGADGLSTRAIARRVGVARSTVATWLKEDRGYSVREREADRKRGERVTAFLADPPGVMANDAAFLRSRTFAWDLLRHCMVETNADKLRGLDLTEPTIGLFQWQMGRGSIQRKRSAQCNLVQALGIRVAALRGLDRLAEARKLFERARELGEKCPACLADLDRRDAVIKRTLELYDEALATVDRAFARYQRLGHHGHDLYGNGIADCLQTRAAIHAYHGRPDLALADAEGALALIDPDRTLDFYGILLVRFGYYLLATGDHTRLLEARRCVDAAMGRLSDICSVQRAKTFWIQGLIEARLGHEDRAELLFMEAHEDLKELRLPRELGVLTTDRAKLGLPDRKKVLVALNDVRVFHAQRGMVVPSWMAEAVDALRSIWKAARTGSEDLASVIRLARDQLEGDLVMPALWDMRGSLPNSSIEGDPLS